MLDLSFGDVRVCKPVVLIAKDVIDIVVTIDVTIANSTVYTSME